MEVIGNITKHRASGVDKPFAETPAQVGLSNVTNDAQVAKDGTIAMTGQLDMAANSVVSTKQTYTGTGTVNIDFTKGGHHYFTHGAGNVTFTFTAPAGDGNFTLWTKQDATGGRTITWPTILTAGGAIPANSTAANSVDMWAVIREGSNWHLVLASGNES